FAGYGLLAAENVAVVGRKVLDGRGAPFGDARLLKRDGASAGTGRDAAGSTADGTVAAAAAFAAYCGAAGIAVGAGLLERFDSLAHQGATDVRGRAKVLFLDDEVHAAVTVDHDAIRVRSRRRGVIDAVEVEAAFAFADVDAADVAQHLRRRSLRRRVVQVVIAGTGGAGDGGAVLSADGRQAANRVVGFGVRILRRAARVGVSRAADGLFAAEAAERLEVDARAVALLILAAAEH